MQLFDPFISLAEIDTANVDSLNIKLIAFNWFRLVVLKLCENIELEELRNIHLDTQKSHHILLQQCNLIFNKLIVRYNGFLINRFYGEHWLNAISPL